MRTTPGATSRFKRAVGCAALALLLWVPAADATTTVASDGLTIAVRGSAAADEIKASVVANPSPPAPDVLKVEDPAGVTVTEGTTTCSPDPLDATVAHCDIPADGGFSSVVAIYGDGGNDKIAGSALVEDIFGGAGDDLIDGGDGNDLIGGGDHPLDPPIDAGVDVLYGGPGGDFITDGEPDNLANADTLSGASCPPDADPVFCASSAPENAGDEDGIGYFRAERVSIDLSSPDPIQGRFGEHDTVVAIESAVTGDGPDVVKGNAERNLIFSGFGDDLVDVQGDDANQDVVDCENDTDSVLIDAADTADNCETVNGVRVIGDDGPPGSPGGTGSAAGGGGGPVKGLPGMTSGIAAKATIRGASSAGTAKVSSNGSITLSKHEIRCPAGGVPCVVRTSLSGAVNASARKKKTAKLGGSAYALAAGRRGAVKLKLTAKGLRLLRRSKRVRGTVTITATKGQAVTTKKVKVTLRAPRKSPKKS